MKKGASLAVAVLTAAIAPLGACTNTNQRGTQPNTSPLTTTSPSAEKMTTQLKSADGTQVANATFDFADGYATVTVEAGPNQLLTPGFHGLQIHSVGKCAGEDFSSAGDVYQAPQHTGYPASGDLSPLEVRPDGAAKLVTTTSSFTAADLKNSSGTALVLHENADNFGTGGDMGKRVACGVISAATTTTTSPTTATTTVTTVTTTTAAPPPSTSTSTVTVTSVPTGTTAPTTTVTTPPSLPPGT